MLKKIFLLQKLKDYSTNRMSSQVQKPRSDTGTPTGAPNELQKISELTSSTVSKSNALLIEYFNLEIKKTKKQVIKNIKKEIESTTKNFGEKIDKVQQDQEQNKINMIEALAIFVALFTFVSVNITIFSKVEYLSAALWFMLLMSISEILILSVFLIFLHKEYTNLKIWLIPAILIILLIFLIITTSNYTQLNPKINNFSELENAKEVTLPNMSCKESKYP